MQHSRRPRVGIRDHSSVSAASRRTRLRRCSLFVIRRVRLLRARARRLRRGCSRSVFVRGARRHGARRGRKSSRRRSSTGRKRSRVGVQRCCRARRLRSVHGACRCGPGRHVRLVRSSGARIRRRASHPSSWASSLGGRCLPQRMRAVSALRGSLQFSDALRVVMATLVRQPRTRPLALDDFTQLANMRIQRSEVARHRIVRISHARFERVDLSAQAAHSLLNTFHAAAHPILSVACCCRAEC